MNVYEFHDTTCKSKGFYKSLSEHLFLSEQFQEIHKCMWIIRYEICASIAQNVVFSSDGDFKEANAGIFFFFLK